MTVTDADKSSKNNNHRFSIHGHGSELFSIDPITGAMKVKTPGTIDCETSTLYEFMVSCDNRIRRQSLVDIRDLSLSRSENRSTRTKRQILCMMSSDYAHVSPIAYSTPENQALDPVVHSR
jgi:hypothetical protein